MNLPITFLIDEKIGLKSRCPKGLTLIELIVVLVIMAISGSLAVVSLRASAEHKEAKQALETARNIGHAVKIFQLETGTLPVNVADLEARGLVRSAEFFTGGGYAYTFVPNIADPAAWSVEAGNAGSGRVVSVTNNGTDFTVSDTSGFLSR